MSLTGAIGRIAQIESMFQALAGVDRPGQAEPAPSGAATASTQEAGRFAAALAQVTDQWAPPPAPSVDMVDGLASAMFHATVGPGTAVAPLEGGHRVTSGYGWRDAIPEAGVGAMFHNGVDLAAPTGTPIRAPFDGTVTYSGWGHPERGNTGWLVEVTHADGTQTMYNHMNAQSPVPVGTAVRAGDVIGEVGSTGNSSGPHLHLSAWVNGNHVDPVEYFAARGVEL